MRAGDTILYGEESVREALQLWGDDAPDPDSDRRADLERCLNTLTDQEVQALGLWSWGFPTTEIAQRVGMSPATAWRFVGRCVAKLRMAMNSPVRGGAC
jgi:DNA-directed RNA polymerase specialized sigma24 family protein